MAAPNEESNPEHEFLSGANAVYIAQLQQKWRQNPLSVDQNGHAGLNSLIIWQQKPHRARQPMPPNAARHGG
jgi:2-oxoglutarate dehydrogenase complex dehydrogenase (E1) component-like enzyme